MNKTALVAGLVALLAGGGAGVGWGFQYAEAARKEKQGELEGLQKKLDEANARAKAEHDRAEQASLDLKVANDAAASIKAKAIADVTSALNSVNDLVVRAKTLESDLKAARDGAAAQIASAQAAAQEKVDQAMKAVSSMQASMQTALAQSSDAAKAEISRLTAGIADQKKSLDSLQQQVAELPAVRSQLASAQQEAASWKQQADQANARAAQLDQRVAALTEELRLLRQSGVKGLLGGK